MTTTTNLDGLVCIVNHCATGITYPDACHRPATHFIQHETWRKPLPCCSTVAYAPAHFKAGWTVTSFDAIRHEVSR